MSIQFLVSLNKFLNNFSSQFILTLFLNNGDLNDIIGPMRGLKIIFFIILFFSIYFALTNYLSYRYVEKKSVSRSNLLTKYFSHQISALKISGTYTKKWVERGIFSVRRFVAVNGEVTIGINLEETNFEVEPVDNGYLISITLPPIRILSTNILEVFDPDGILGKPEVYNKIIEESMSFLKRKALQIEYKMRAYETLRFEIETVYRNIFPRENLFFKFSYASIQIPRLER